MRGELIETSPAPLSAEQAESLILPMLGEADRAIFDEHGEVAINELFDTRALYQGPYLDDAPDFLVGYNHGYRISWDGATGVIDTPVFEDNVKAWSGDHGVDPRIVPGVIFCNRQIDKKEPALIDIAPTALELFGLRPPAHMDGTPLFDRDRSFEE